ncbi:MAG TPA: hypothetical protein DEA96_18060 [Leptospiraceae bacterium]|nr:hypothetical protein [Spirochaetaceae bacterium]HBS06880.1 hypothetical protein [Leptospiraceae bacterium]
MHTEFVSFFWKVVIIIRKLPILLPLLVLTFCTLQDDSSLVPPAGKKLVHDSGRNTEVYIFCPDWVTVEYKNSRFRPHMRRGIWKRNADKIEILWQSEYGGEGVGEPLGDCATDCRYHSYEKFHRSIDFTIELDWNHIEEHPFGDWSVSDHPLDCDSGH